MKKILVALCSIAFLLLLPFETTMAKEWSFQSIEDSFKAWKVNFSMELDETTVTSSNIYVTDGKEVHTTKPVLTNGGKTVEVYPNSTFQTGKLYKLVVTTNVKSADGKFLKESVEMPFKVVDSTAIIKTVYSVTSNILTALTVVTNNDVFDVKINGESFHYKGNNTYEYMLIGNQPGDKIIINAYDESNKLMEKTSYTIGE